MKVSVIAEMTSLSSFKGNGYGARLHTAPYILDEKLSYRPNRDTLVEICNHFQTRQRGNCNALQLEAARRHAVLIRCYSLPVESLKSLSLSVVVLERIYCSYVTLRCDLEL